MELITLLAALALLACVLVWDVRLRHAHRRTRAATAPLLRYPSVTIVRPLRGLDVGAADNFRAALATGYPGEVETLFVLDDESDPALPVVRAIVDEHRASHRPGTADVVIAGAPPEGRTGKLNAMIVGAEHARGELLAFGDSDTRPDRHLLRELVETLLETEGAGSAFAQVVVHEPPRKAGDVLYALLQNALYAPLAAHATGPHHELPFIMGQLMVFRREALADIGGLAAADGHLVDDMYLGRRLAAAGWRNVLIGHPLHIETGGLGLREFLPIYRRWMDFSRNGLELRFTWPQWLLGGIFYLSLAAATVAALRGEPITTLAFAAAAVAVCTTLVRLNHEYGGAPIPMRYAWGPAAVLLLAPPIYLGAILRKHVDWRGRAYRISRGAALTTRR